MKPTTPTVTHETNLDFIRAFAVLLVVSSHLWYFFGNIQVSIFQPTTIGQLGAVGVLIFFVHSGIVNMLSIERHVQKHGSYRLFRVFMTRRCFRIYPLSIVVVSVIFFTKIPLAHLDQFSASVSSHASGEFLPSLLLVQNFVQFHQILEPLWSLPYEVQIYCLFPLVYLLLRRYDSAKILICGWVLLSAVDTAFAPPLMKYAKLGDVLVVPDMLFFILLFLAGLCAFKEMQATRPELPFWVLPTVLTASCVLWLFSHGQSTIWLLLSLGLGLTIPHIRSCRIQSLSRSCGWIAKYSYGIYLLHSPAIWLGFFRLSHFGAVVRIGAFLLTTFGGSVLLYHVLEHPMIAVGNKLAAVIARKKSPTRALAIATGGPSR